MISKKFYINIFVRIILILITCLSIVPFLYKEERLFTILSLIILLLLQIYLLIKYINLFNTEVAYFFSALKTNDASFAFHDKAFPYICEEFRKDVEFVRVQLFSITELKEIQGSYLKTVIENTQTGIITIDELGNVDIINRYALEVLGITRIANVKALKYAHPGFYQIITNTSIVDEKMIVIKGKTKAIPVAIRISEFKQKTKKLKLISFQNIESELNEKELLSWNKLIRVLTHEINNSISPITSLASSLEKLLIDGNQNVKSKEEISDETIEKTTEGLQLITRRGEGLIDFVNNYKSIASLKQMDFETIKLAELFYNLELLMKKELEEKDLNLSIELYPFDIEVRADKKYLEQICINLIKNSIEASNKSGQIKLIGRKEKNHRTYIEITDNGKGIEQELINQIFVPFFTTKENGSGIGLSLARQIMQLHGGSISVESEPNKLTSFKLKF